MNTSNTTRGGDLVVFAVMAALACITALVWLWGGLAGTLFGDGWPSLRLAALLHVLVALPRHIDAPRAAWPVRARTLLPGTTALYATLVALVALLATMLALLSARLRTLARHRGRGGWGGARWIDRNSNAVWASSAELRTLRAPRRRLARIGLGRYRHRMLYAEARHALIAFGPPQSGKSAGLAIPALLEWQGPAVASSIKGDLLDSTLTRRRELGEALVFDPFGLSGVPSMTWSPLHGAHSWDGALEVAWRLASAGELDQRSVEGGDFWAIAAEQRLAPLLFLGASTRRPIETVVAWAYGQGQQELERSLGELLDGANGDRQWSDARRAHEAIRSFDQQADRTRSSIEATVQGLLRAYRFTRVANSAHGSEITAERLLSGSGTLYLVGDAKASKLLRPLMVALLGEIVDRAYELAGEQGGSLIRPLLLCLDEAGNVAPLPNLAEIASTAPSHGIQLLSIFHDLTQARSRYSGQAETVVNSHRARMLLPGVADLQTLRYFSSLIGEGEQRETTRTTGAGGNSRSFSSRHTPLLSSDALRRLDDGEAILLYGRLPPARLRLRLWFKDRRLRALQAGGGESTKPRRRHRARLGRRSVDMQTTHYQVDAPLTRQPENDQHEVPQ